MAGTKRKPGHPRKMYLVTDTSCLTFYCQICGEENKMEDACFVWDREDNKVLKVCGKHEGDNKFKSLK